MNRIFTNSFSKLLAVELFRRAAPSVVNICTETAAV